MTPLREAIADAFHEIAASIPEVAHVVAYRGTRKGGVSIAFPLADVLFTSPDFADPASDGSSGTTLKVYTVRILEDDWPETDPPQHGDTMELDDGAVLHVEAVHPKTGYWLLEVRQ